VEIKTGKGICSPDKVNGTESRTDFSSSSRTPKYYNYYCFGWRQCARGCSNIIVQCARFETRMPIRGLAAVTAY
jgi:hypothetical protein